VEMPLTWVASILSRLALMFFLTQGALDSGVVSVVVVVHNFV